MVGPVAFAVLSVALLVYDHLNQRVPALVFWLTLGLIVTIFVRMVETNRRQSKALAKQRHDALNDPVTGLRNRGSLEADIAAAAAAAPGAGWVLVLVELEGFEAQNDRRGPAAGDDIVRGFARQLADAVIPLGGIAYRIAASRLALLVPAGERPLGEIVLTTAGALQSDPNTSMNRSYGEVTIPNEARDAETAFQVAGKRLAAQRQRQNRSARRQAHAVLMAAVTARHPELRDDLRLVAYRSIALSRRLEMSAEEIDDIALAAELQDVGMLAVPESVLEKKALDEAEQAMVRSHTAEGARIISAAPGLATVARLVRSSAEHFDGSGYPDGLAADAIPLGSRVLGVAVAFVAMTERRRPHREPVGPGEALAELRRNAGSQFDPRVVEALARDLAEEAAPVSAPA
jgi:two-component system, cell cycle response regulator